MDQDDESFNLAETEIKQVFPQLNVNFSYQEWYGGSDEKQVYCEACYEVISGPAYICKDYPPHTIALHKTCTESPCQIQHSLHPDHPLQADCLSITLFRGILGGFVCDGCSHYSFGFGYRCDDCNFKLDFRCAFNLQIRLEEKREIKEDFHDHKLQRFFHNMLLSADPEGFQDIVCSCCSKGFNGSAFTCLKCQLFIHEYCIREVQLKKEIISPFHKHTLFRSEKVLNRGWCQACRVNFRTREFFLRCRECIVADEFHISCASLSTRGLRLKQYHKEHPLFYVYSAQNSDCEARICAVCNTKCDDCHVYCCLDCHIFLHLECIPLARVVKHESHTYDDHVLTLSDSKDKLDFASDEYHCIVCEKQGNLNHPFYHCEQCSDVAHVECVLSEEDPPSLILEYLVPRTVEKSVPRSTEEVGGQEDEKSKEKNDDQQAKLDDCSLMEIDQRIDAIMKQMDELTLQLQVHREARLRKVKSSILSLESAGLNRLE